MKLFRLTMFFMGIIVLGSFCSCVSLKSRPLTAEQRANGEVLGQIETSFTTYQLLHIPNLINVKVRAYSDLLRLAHQGYSGKIDVANIKIKGRFSHWNWLPIAVALPSYGASVALGHFQKITTRGDIIAYDIKRAKIQSIEFAVYRATQALFPRIPKEANIAILSISPPDNVDFLYAIDRLEYQLVNAGDFTIIDRRRPEQIRIEQQFQISDEVSDDSAAAIGNMLGASIVITGSISNSGNWQVLRLRALDVKSGRIIAMAREQF